MKDILADFLLTANARKGMQSKKRYQSVSAFCIGKFIAETHLFLLILAKRPMKQSNNSANKILSIIPEIHEDKRS